MILNSGSEIVPAIIEESKTEEKSSKIGILRNKVLFVSRMMRMFKTLREESETVVQLKGMCPDNKIPRGLLQLGGEAMKDQVEVFDNAKQADKINEKMPEY
jgi:serine/threonine-protein phosphatase 2B catalytic subunit